MYYIILEITLGRVWSHTSYSISQVKMIKRKLNSWEGMHKENNKIEKTGDNKKNNHRRNNEK